MASSHRLAAIMFTDIVGYTSMMERDEQLAIGTVKRHEQIVEKAVGTFSGEVHQYYGDGSLSVFSSAIDAVYAAHQIQAMCQEQPKVPLRIGIHLGEVSIEEEKIFGSGVNLASRIQSETPEGEINVSEIVYSNIRNQAGITLDYVGQKVLKNVEKPVEVYTVTEVIPEGPPAVSSDKTRTNWKVITICIAALTAVVLVYFLGYKSKPTPTETDISIAVLAFRNMSGDPKMEAFCDGMTDAVISRLSKISGIGKVISLTSVMALKGTQKTMPEIASELNVTHILEAGFQKSGDDIKINLQLIDGPSDAHFWSDEYNGKHGDIFGIQAEVAELVAKNLLNTEITQDELADIRKSPTENVKAYEYYLRGKYIMFQYAFFGGESDFLRAIELYEKAIELDSNFAEAYAGLADLYDGKSRWNVAEFSAEDDSTMFALLRKAYKLDPNSSYVNRVMAWPYMPNMDRSDKENFDSAYYHLKKALELDPENADNYLGMGVFLSWLGFQDIALNYYNKALELSPLDMGIYWYMALAHSTLGNNQQRGEAVRAFLDLSGEEDLPIYLNYLIFEARFDEAEEILARRERKGKSNTNAIALMHAMKNEREEALALLDDIPKGVRIWIYLHLEMKEEVYQHLNDMRENGKNLYTNLEHHYLYDPYRNDPEFQEIKAKAKVLHDEYKRKYPTFGLSEEL